MFSKKNKSLKPIKKEYKIIKKEKKRKEKLLGINILIGYIHLKP